MSQLLSAVSHCHSKNIMHRDLKPENLLINSITEDSVSIKLIDFGTAKVFNPGEKLQERVGSAYYVAPEVIKDSYDEKCDIWSCGIIMYTLLSGEPPFIGTNDEETLKKVRLGVVLFKGTTTCL